MATHPQHAATRTAATQEEVQVSEQAAVPEGELPAPTDPWKVVYSPYELPANTAAAQAIAAVVTVDPTVPISAERQAQAEAAIQEHQDNMQEVVAVISDDPRLSGTTFEEHAAKQAEESAARAAARSEA